MIETFVVLVFKILGNEKKQIMADEDFYNDIMSVFFA